MKGLLFEAYWGMFKAYEDDDNEAINYYLIKTIELEDECLRINGSLDLANEARKEAIISVSSSLASEG